MKERDSVCVCEREKETKRDLVQFEKDICITGWRENQRVRKRKLFAVIREKGVIQFR